MRVASPPSKRPSHSALGIWAWPWPRRESSGEMKIIVPREVVRAAEASMRGGPLRPLRRIMRLLAAADTGRKPEESWVTALKDEGWARPGGGEDEGADW